MNMTIFVDASLHPQTGAAGWGAWLIRDSWPKGRFDDGEIVLKSGKVNSSTIAELAGIGLALWRANRRGDLDGITNLLIQCDCLNALEYIRFGVPAKQGKGGIRIEARHWSNKRKIVGSIIETIRVLTTGMVVKVKHVKGHQESNSGSAWVNNQCDAAAKRNMRSLHARLLSTDLELS